MFFILNSFYFNAVWISLVHVRLREVRAKSPKRGKNPRNSYQIGLSNCAIDCPTSTSWVYRRVPVRIVQIVPTSKAYCHPYP